jgi:tetratricopeptide (TPR) repeat protein
MLSLRFNFLMDWCKNRRKFLVGFYCFVSITVFAQTDISDSLKSLFLDLNHPAQNRIDIGVKLTRGISIVEDNININKATEHLILESTTNSTYKTNLNQLYDLLTIRAILYKLGQNLEAALETISASRAVSDELGDVKLSEFVKASELYQSMPGTKLDSSLQQNLSLYKYFLNSKRTFLAGLCLQNAGDVKFIEKNYGDAINYYKKSLSLQNVNHTRLITPLLNSQIGQCYLALGSNELAYSYLDASYQMHLLEGNKEEQAINLYYIAKSYFNKGDTKTAEEIINKVRLVTSMLKDSYFKKLIVVQLSAISSVKREEQLHQLFNDSKNKLNTGSIVPEGMPAIAAAGAYQKNIELMKKGNSTVSDNSKKSSGRPAWLFVVIALGGVVVFWSALKLFKKKNP